MGQYWIPVNLTKREFIMPHKLGSGLKLWEQLSNQPGVGAALIVLCAAQREPRGDGDFDMTENWHGPERKFPEHNMGGAPMPEEYPAVAARTIGRWAGDQIAIVGDYAEDGDLAPEHAASKIYGLCREPEELREHVDNARAKAKRAAKGKGKAAKITAPASPFFTDITDDVCRVIEHELGGKFEGEGWRREWKPMEDTGVVQV